VSSGRDSVFHWPLRVRNAGHFKETVLAEWEGLGEEGDLKPVLRDYVNGLRGVHGPVRTILGAREPKWENHIVSARTWFQHNTEDPAARLYELRKIEDEGQVFSQGVFEEFLLRLDYLRQKNVLGGDLNRLLRSSE
jgi:hypothetical protein